MAARVFHLSRTFFRIPLILVFSYYLIRESRSHARCLMFCIPIYHWFFQGTYTLQAPARVLSILLRPSCVSRYPYIGRTSVLTAGRHSSGRTRTPPPVGGVATRVSGSRRDCCQDCIPRPATINTTHRCISCQVCILRSATTSTRCIAALSCLSIGSGGGTDMLRKM